MEGDRTESTSGQRPLVLRGDLFLRAQGEGTERDPGSPRQREKSSSPTSPTSAPFSRRVPRSRGARHPGVEAARENGKPCPRISSAKSPSFPLPAPCFRVAALPAFSGKQWDARSLRLPVRTAVAQGRVCSREGAGCSGGGRRRSARSLPGWDATGRHAGSAPAELSAAGGGGGAGGGRGAGQSRPR